MTEIDNSKSRYTFLSTVLGTAFITDESGFSMLELLFAMIILVILTILAYPSYEFLTNKVKLARASEEIRVLEKEIQAFSFDRGALPDELTNVNRAGMRDPWGNAYQYKTAARAGGDRRVYLEPINDDFDLYSYGRNGISTPRIDTAAASDDVMRGGNGSFVGLASEF